MAVGRFQARTTAETMEATERKHAATESGFKSQLHLFFNSFVFSSWIAKRRLRV